MSERHVQIGTLYAEIERVEPDRVAVTIMDVVGMKVKLNLMDDEWFDLIAALSDVLAEETQ